FGEAVDVVKTWGQAGEIVRQASNQNLPRGGLGWRESFLLEPGEDKRVDRVPDPTARAHSGRSGLLERLKSPMRGFGSGDQVVRPRCALADPFFQCCDLGIGKPGLAE